MPCQWVQCRDELVKNLNFARLIGCFVDGVQELSIVRENVPGSGGFLPVEGNGDIETNPIHPGGESSAFIECPKRPPELIDDLLSQVFPLASISAV